MAVFRPTFTKPLPAAAELFERAGQRYAKWIDRKGRKRTAPVAVAKDGALRIRLECRTFTVQQADAGGVIRRTRTGCREQGNATAKEGELRSRKELVLSGVLSAEQDAVADASGVPLAEHFEAYRAHLAAKGCTARHIDTVNRRLHKLTAECCFERVGDLNAAGLESWLALQAEVKKSAQTRNHYRTAAVAFASWLVRTKRLMANPFEAVEPANVAADRKHVRRALTAEEIGRLLTTAALRPLAEFGREKKPVAPEEGEPEKRANWTYAPLTWENIAAAADLARKRFEKKPGKIEDLEARGREHALAYRVLLLTGLRKKELRAIRLADMDLDGERPSLTLRAADEKARRGALLPLRRDLAVELREWIAGRLQSLQAAARLARKPLPMKLPADALLFSLPKALDKVFNRDLAAAGISKRDDRDRVADVHGLRTTFGSHLSASGVSLRTAQAAMRHSDPKLTANVYTDPQLLDVGAALNMLPSMAAAALTPKRQALAVGAESDTENGDRTLAPLLALNSDFSSTQGSIAVHSATFQASPAASRNPMTPKKNPRFPGGNLWSGRKDLNLRPPVPETGATEFPDVAPQGVTESPTIACTSACTRKPESIHETAPATVAGEGQDRGFAAAVQAVMVLPLTPEEKAEAVRRLLADKE